MLGAENIAVNKTDQISTLIELMDLVPNRGKIQIIVGTENKCKVPEAFVLYAFQQSSENIITSTLTEFT